MSRSFPIHLPRPTRSHKFNLRVSAAIAALLSANAAHAAGTPAATIISNTVFVDYQVGGVAQEQREASVTFQVDRKVSFVLTETGATPTSVIPGEANAVTVFQLTNQANATLDFALSAVQLNGGVAAHSGLDNFDMDGSLSVFADSNGNGVYEPGTDTATFVDDLAADQTVTVFVIGSTPLTVFGGDLATVELSATAREGGATGLGGALSQSTSDTSGVDTVFADGSGTSDAVRDATFTARDDYRVADQDIDLEVAIGLDNATPLIGFDQYTVTATVLNNGPANASGVTLHVPLPGGAGLRSHTAASAWTPTTGLWTVGTLAAGESKSFTYTVVAGGEGSFAATARVSAADQADSDSSPSTGFDTDDLGDGINDDDEASSPISAVRGTGTISARSCATGTSALDWAAAAWTPTSLSGSYTVAGKPIALTVSDAAGALISTAPYYTPANAAFYQGGLPSVENGLNFAAQDSKLTPAGIGITIQLGPEGIGVSDLRFKLFDLDGNGTLTRIEQVVVSGSLAGAPVLPMLSGGSAVSISGNQARGTIDSATTGSGSGAGTLEVGFDGRVDQVTLTWGNAPLTISTSGSPGFALHDLSFCTPPTGLSVAKESEPFNSSSSFYTPGNEVIYTISVANTGEVPTDADSLFIVDAMPSELAFYNGDYDGAGPASTPLGFAQTGAGMTFSYSTDVAFSNGATAPLSFSACTYTPISGHDPNVRFICLNPKGQLEASTPQSAATFRFRARIQ